MFHDFCEILPAHINLFLTVYKEEGACLKCHNADIRRLSAITDRKWPCVMISRLSAIVNVYDKFKAMLTVYLRYKSGKLLNYL